MTTTGPPRPARLDDLPQVGSLLDDVFRRSRGVYDQSQLTDFPLVFCPGNLANNRLIEVDSRVVSHAGLWPRRMVVHGSQFRVAIIVSVATHPEYRHRGLAARLMASLQESLHAQAYDFAVLWTSVPDFYLKLGWELTTPRGIIIEIPSQWADQVLQNHSEFTVSLYDPQQDLIPVLELYNQHAIRLERNRDEAAALFSLPKVPVWVAKRSGQVLAYVAHGQAINKHGIAEHGGRLEGILAILQHIARNLPKGDQLQVLAYHSCKDLADWAHSQSFPTSPLPSSKGTNYEMIYCVSPSAVPKNVRDDLFVWGLDHA